MDRVHGGFAAGLVILLIGCDLTPGKPFSWKATVDTEFTVPAGQRFPLFSYQFDEPFQVGSGAFKGKMQIIVPRSVISTVPRTIDLRFSQFRLGSNATTPIDFYDVTASLKTRRLGSNLRLTYTFSDRVTPPLDFLAFDSLQVSLQPSGGDIGKNWHVYGAYTFIPAKGTAGSTTTTSSTTTTIPLGRALTVDAAFATESGGQFTAGQVLCLSQITGGCVAAPGQCPAVHLHSAAGPSGTITVTAGGTLLGPYVDPESTGMHCGYGEVATSTSCGPDTLPACP